MEDGILLIKYLHRWNKKSKFRLYIDLHGNIHSQIPRETLSKELEHFNLDSTAHLGKTKNYLEEVFVLIAKD